MNRVVFVSSRSAPDPITEWLSTAAYVLATVGAFMAGWQGGGLLWALLYAAVMLVAFPFLLAFGTILFLACYPLLALPGTFIANKLGWTVTSPYAVNRFWLQRLSVIVLLIPIIVLLERNTITFLGFLTGVAAFGLMMLGLLIALPVLLLVGLFLYALTRSRSYDPDGEPVQWKQLEPTRVPPPE